MELTAQNFGKHRTENERGCDRGNSVSITSNYCYYTYTLFSSQPNLQPKLTINVPVVYMGRYEVV
jgi:hypothetical protein